MPTRSKPRSLSVLPLDPGQSCLPPDYANYLGACAAVCLEKRHQPGVSLTLAGDYEDSFLLTWEQLTEQHYRTYADIQEATEQGAYGIAILVVREAAGKTVLERAAKGGGFDFWIGDEEDDELPFQGLTRLEVSGILEGDDSKIQTRTKQKQSQVARSDGQTPALIAIVEFGRPLARLEQK